MTVRNWLTSNYEKILYIAPDGKKYNFHDPAQRSVILMEGWGMPTPEIATTRGPYQHGVNPLSVRVPQRLITMSIRHVGCSRDEYWSMRSGLLDALRWNRSSLDNPQPGSIRRYLSNGQVRQLDVMVINGPSFAKQRGGWDEYGYSDILIFAAYNPIVYDPSRVTEIFTDLGCDSLGRLQFPFYFGTSDIVFGITICSEISDLSLTYTGTWQTFPMITVTGPFTNFVITHNQTGDKIELEDYSVAAGDSVVFDLTYGKKTVTQTSTGGSLLGEISEDSNLGTFSIEPDPTVANGINDFTVQIDDGTGDTQVIFQYYTRYIGI